MNNFLKKSLQGGAVVGVVVLAYVGVVGGQALLRDEFELEPKPLEPGFTAVQLHNAVVDLVALRMREGVWSFPVALGADYQADEFEAVAALEASRTLQSQSSTCSAVGSHPVVMSTLTKGAWLASPSYALDGFADTEEELFRFADENKNVLLTYASTDGGATGMTVHLKDHNWWSALSPRVLSAPKPYPHAATGPCMELQLEHAPSWLRNIPTRNAASKGQFKEFIAPSGRTWQVIEGRGQLRDGNLDRTHTKPGFVITGTGPELEALLQELKADVESRGGRSWLDMRFSKIRSDTGAQPRVSQAVFYRFADGSSRLITLLTSPTGSQLALSAAEVKAQAVEPPPAPLVPGASGVRPHASAPPDLPGAAGARPNASAPVGLPPGPPMSTSQ